MKSVLGSLVAFCIFAAPAAAATVTNKDGATVVLTVVENGSRMEIVLDAGGSETLCPTGCFVTLPNGDRIALDGGENVEILNGSAVIK
ncbi:hypothetical protein LJR030_004970 [Rhizobium sp. LjRoot30]|uniref:hypothetical protein n=1 Tax=Rhizobium sp. LjRoot30 TaxID=3342320 RepID=UPI003ECFB3D5